MVSTQSIRNYPHSQATDPAEEKLRIKMRKAKRKMKGVNLQYVADRRVFFDDVAGIGEAKVCHSHLLFLLPT